jgi:hypothetical protein
MRLTGSFAADGAPLLRYQPTRAATTQPHVHAAHSHNHDASGASEHRVDSGHDVTLQSEEICSFLLFSVIILSNLRPFFQLCNL